MTNGPTLFSMIEDKEARCINLLWADTKVMFCPFYALPPSKEVMTYPLHYLLRGRQSIKYETDVQRDYLWEFYSKMLNEQPKDAT